MAFASLLIAVLSGIPLAVPFDIRNGFDSLAVMLLTNPAAAFFRNLHYWSGQLFLVLTLAHAWDHLRRRTETRLRRGVWLRTALTAPLAAFLMLSGFMLKGDAEAQQAARILSAVFEQVPVVGQMVSLLVLGSGENRQVLYIHHAATASILVWIFVAEHARAMWPRKVAVLEAFLLAAAVSLFLSPSLHDGLNPVVKGPWYFLGLQEMLHWTTRPALLVAAGLTLLALLVALPRLSDRLALASKWLLVSLVFAYAALTIVGTFFRGEAWAWESAWPRASSGITVHGLAAWWGPPIDAIRKHPVPVVLGRREGCLFCHAGVKGLSASHSAEAVGCASCHHGNPFTLDKGTAHANMVLVPGNLADADRSCGTSACHPGIAPRVRGSLMNTMAGIVAVDREIWKGGGRGAEGVRPASVGQLGHAGADSHLRQLCASCHLGAEKTAWGGVHETSRGGGCNACHLTYSPEASRALSKYVQARSATGNRLATTGRQAGSTDPPSLHPNVSIAISGDHCFGCHSRSGRISTNYEGWHETQLEAVPGEADSHRYRTLEDGRVFTFVQADIHAEKGMECVDCHTSREVMGDGIARARKWEPIRVGCEDCHFGGPPRTVTVEQLDPESLKIAKLRSRAQPGARFLAGGAEPLVNTSIDAAGKSWLTTKRRGERLELRAPAPVCAEGGGHARLSCVSCHSAWAPRCTGCHTKFDPAREGVDLLTGEPTKGDWIETSSGFSAVPPTLGMRKVPGSRILNPGSFVVDPFIPGMVISLDRNQVAGGKPDNVFRRLYARAFSHTISKGARSCQSCHNDPVALGYGEGQLVFEREVAGGWSRDRADSGREADVPRPSVNAANSEGLPRRGGEAAKGAGLPPRSVGAAKAGRWRFTSTHRPGPDGLPAGAWIGFLQERLVGASTRPDARPLTVEEQKRILTVGACLTCHEPASPAMRRSVADWPATLRRVTPRCVVPRW